MDQGIVFDDVLTPPILEFKGEYRFLSNFYVASFMWRGLLWPSSEHAYQAAKTEVKEEQQLILNLPTPVAAKRAGKLITLRPDWDEVKVDIMTEIVCQKFRQNPELKAKLLATGDAHLEEGNTWGDKVWGVCPPGSGNGRNELGKALMLVRDYFNGIL